MLEVADVRMAGRQKTTAMMDTIQPKERLVYPWETSWKVAFLNVPVAKTVVAAMELEPKELEPAVWRWPM